MVRRKPEEEKGERGHRVTCVISVKKLDNCPRLQLVNLPTFRLGVLFPRSGNIISGRTSCSSECINQMHKEEKSFVKENKQKLAASPVEKVTKNRKIMQIHQVLLPNLHQSTHERISSMEKNIAKYSLNAEFKGGECYLDSSYDSTD
ncbi:uncharacterized protein TNCV_4421131 [Trichonephila clavipes]|nr:uncharacterized protein TNCV_4421131 [Trichonephila clavipes]